MGTVLSCYDTNEPRMAVVSFLWDGETLKTIVVITYTPTYVYFTLARDSVTIVTDRQHLLTKAVADLQ
jgi:hypothetical protein